jgi:hypothetical protein
MQKEYKGTAFSADVGDEKHHVIDQANSLIGSWNSGDDCKSRAQLYILFANTFVARWLRLQLWSEPTQVRFPVGTNSVAWSISLDLFRAGPGR